MIGVPNFDKYPYFWLNSNLHGDFQLAKWKPDGVSYKGVASQLVYRPQKTVKK